VNFFEIKTPNKEERMNLLDRFFPLEIEIVAESSDEKICLEPTRQIDILDSLWLPPEFFQE
jgi:hypothetical protein